MPAGHYAARAKTTPLRLSDDERSMLRVLEGALTVSEYTDKVDVISYRSNKVHRIQQQLGDMFAILSGMVVASKGKQGQSLIEDRAVSENPDLFASIFEVGRRHKVMNPDKMRGNYGKLMFMLQDAQTREIRDSIGFSVVRTVLTVRLGRTAGARSQRGGVARGAVHTQWRWHTCTYTHAHAHAHAMRTRGARTARWKTKPPAHIMHRAKMAATPQRPPARARASAGGLSRHAPTPPRDAPPTPVRT